jgi:hypothetical protein
MYSYNIKTLFTETFVKKSFEIKTNDIELVILSIFNFIKREIDYKIDTRNVGEIVKQNEIRLEFYNYKLEKEFYVNIYGREKEISDIYDKLWYLVELFEKSNE